MITIVDYQTGNLGSISNMLKKLGVASRVTSDPAVVADAEKLVLPGVGAFDTGMRNLRELGLVDALNRKAMDERVPTLGVCLGMQLMTHGSTEGREPGLGWVDAKVERFAPKPEERLKVPHMGWNLVVAARASPLLAGLPEQSRFYFVHSYHVHCAEREDVLLTAHHGITFDAAFERGNLVGVQFHPEKSHRFGLALLKNFAGFEARC